MSVSRTLSPTLRRLAKLPHQTLRQHFRSVATATESHSSEPSLPSREPSLPPSFDRLKQIRDAKPFSEFLTDNFNRQHDYLRISLTERCNLRCLYCMPEEGIQLSPSRDILTTAEIYYLSALFVDQGVNKIRLTGGEPTVRKDIIPLMQQLGSLRSRGLKEIALTTNGISLHRKLDDMVKAGLTGVNISLDTLDPFQFQLLTRRQGFEAVMKSITRVQEMNKMGANIKLKINCVAMRGLNDHQIIPFVEMTREQDIEVRFIEYMPFDGNKWSQNKMLPYAEMLEMIRKQYPTLARLKDARNDTSKTWQVPGFQGRIGFITSMTHNFCGTCNRLRITSDGNLKVCLHGNAEVSLRDILRRDHNGDPMDEAAFEAIRQLELDRRENFSGVINSDRDEGWISKERQLLEVIGAAVKRKKEKHAGIGQLENMKNRPMILIDKQRLVPITSVGTTIRHNYQSSGFRSFQRPNLPVDLLSQTAGSFNTLRLYSSRKRELGQKDELPSRAQIRSDGLHITIENPWGLGSDSGRRTAAPSPAVPPVEEQEQPSQLQPSVAQPSTAFPSPDSAQNNTTLTHLTSTGAAHMVSITPKPSTRRIAIATAYITFSNPTPLRLIRENSNKKGDVLSVARIAGIMAAKRTADLIPLCHPVALSKVEVDLELISPAATGSPDHYDRGSDNANGLVAIQALVECVGPTGVEMEAMTAVAAAALTVYDMCKGVDRRAVVQAAKVVFKSGGRSGKLVDQEWARRVGKSYFAEKGLETSGEE